MKHLCRILGALIIMAGIGCGLYAGIVYGLVGGVISIIEAGKQTPVESAGVAWGIARVLFSGLMGWGIAVLGMFFGGIIINFGRFHD